MKHTLYEAAVRYDFERWMPRDGVTFPVHELVIDLDGCGIGLCRCEETGIIRLLDQISNLQPVPSLDQVWMDRVRQERTTGENLTALLEPGVVQDRLWNYYLSGKRLDRDALMLSDGPLTCCSLDRAFEPVRAALRDLLEQGMECLEKLKIPEEELRVLEVGRLAACAPGRLAVREVMTFDPFLTDSRFVEPDRETPTNQIVQMGRELLEQTRMVGFDLVLLCLDEKGESGESIRLAERRQLLSTLKEPAYGQPLFVCPGDRLRFRTEETEWQEELPYDIGPIGGDFVEAACGLRDDKPIILLRRTLSPTRVYEIALRQ